MAEMGYIKKSRVASLVLCFFFGMLGVHRFYLGKNSSGAIMLILTLIGAALSGILIGLPLLAITFIWAVFDFLGLLLGFGDMKQKVYR
ncbi:MAG: TM2 domain-containing protein [Campylobacterales bacterium]